jgi:hypothetical protein
MSVCVYQSPSPPSTALLSTLSRLVLVVRSEGETLHVDFGILFDRGLTLEVPERVPFRMTQNVVDCFGVSGVEGTFRQAAEMTIQVRRFCFFQTS